MNQISLFIIIIPTKFHPSFGTRTGLSCNLYLPNVISEIILSYSYNKLSNKNILSEISINFEYISFILDKCELYWKLYLPTYEEYIKMDDDEKLKLKISSNELIKKITKEKIIVPHIPITCKCAHLYKHSDQ